MRVTVTADTYMTNPIGDGRDYGSGEGFEVDEATGEAWITRGWVQRSTRPLGAVIKPRSGQDDARSDAP